MAGVHVGWTKVKEIYPSQNFKKGCIKPFVLMVPTIIALLLCKDINAINAIKMACSLITSGFPSIIGFILTGYTLIIGFSGSDFLLKMAKSKADETHSLFERVNSTFAVIIAILILTYILASVVSFIEDLHIYWPLSFGCKTFNISILLLLLFFFYYSLCALLDVVMNVFNLGQLAHAVAQNRLKVIESMVEDDANKEYMKEDKKNFLSKIIDALLNPCEV